MDLGPIGRASVSDEVLARLLDEIPSGRIEPGEAHPGEPELAERFRVNRHEPSTCPGPA